MTRTGRRPPGTGDRSSPTEWLELLAVDGPFLAAPVVTDIWPGGLPAVNKDDVSALREASSVLDASPGTRDAFVRHVLTSFLGWKANHVGAGHVPSTLSTPVPEYGTEVRPDFALLTDLDDPAAAPLLLGLVLDPGVRATARPRPGAPGAGKWPASFADRLGHALRARKVALGLVTDGTEWTLVCAPAGGATTTATWTRHTWFDEPDTLKAFAALLGRLRFFGVPDEHTLPALLAASLDRQEEITTRLSEQSRSVVEMLVATIGRLDAEHRAQHGEPLLPAAVEPAEVYQGAVTVLMRMVFLLYAEERGLLPIDDDTYADSYAISTLVGQLREHASDAGEDTLERSSTAWHRMLATFRAVHRGARHDQLALPGYGGSLFDPDRFPWLEGRRTADTGLDDSSPLPIDDRTLLRALEALQWLRFTGERRHVSFRVLDVEQIGYVYEGLLDQDARRAHDWILGVAGDNKGDKDGPEIALTDLIGHLEQGLEHFASWLSGEIKIGNGNRSPAAISKALTRSIGAVADTAWTGVLEACGGDETTAKSILPFAGLLRRDPRDLPVVYPPGSLYLTDSELRAHTGAVYTPRALAEQVVARTLEPLVKSPGPLDTEDEAAWKIRTPEQILALKVIDIAAGSGAFLVAATRYLADRLLDARRAHEPAQVGVEFFDDEQAVIDARRQILDHCIYGVDINPMALEMAKLSLWLVTLDRNRPFGFLDDRLAVGDSLLGLTSSEQLLDMHLDPKEGRKSRNHEHIAAYTADVPGLLKQAAALRQRIANIDLIDSHSAEHKARLLRESQELTQRLTVLADALSGASLSGGTGGQYGAVAAGFGLATSGSGSDTAWRTFKEDAQFSLTDERGQLRHPAHFPLLFPEVFTTQRTGFDAVVGNPPFLGGKKLRGAFGSLYRDNLVRAIGGRQTGGADLIAYMFLTAASLCDRDRGALGLIATNSIAQGDTREVGLDQIAADFDIYAAVKSEKWPTRGASLEYSIVWASRRARGVGVRGTADGLRVKGITPSLDPVGRVTGNPHRLVANRGVAYQGSVVLGMGFTMTQAEAQVLIDQDARNAEVLFPFVNGEDLNSRPDSSGSRWIINLANLSKAQASSYTEPWAWIEQHVYPERMTKDRTKYPQMVDEWWKYWRPRPALYASIGGLSRVVVIALVSNVVMPVCVKPKQVFSHQTAVFATDDLAYLALLSSAPHYWWAITRASTIGVGAGTRYTPSDVFETLPRPVFTARMRAAGEAIDCDRREFMLGRQLGLTKTYNRIHDPDVSDVEVAHLRALHVEVDDAVCEAYGWDDLSLDHGHYDTRQGVRWTVSPAARLELLDRLLELNQARHADEQAASTPSPIRRKGRGMADSLPAVGTLFDTDEDA